MGDKPSKNIPLQGDSDSVRFSDGEYIEGVTLKQHLDQMKLSAFVAIDLPLRITYYMLRKNLIMIETLLGMDRVEFYRAVILISSCVFGCIVLNKLFSKTTNS